MFTTRFEVWLLLLAGKLNVSKCTTVAFCSTVDKALFYSVGY